MTAPGRSFKDHFSGHAAAYAQHRPTYPESLFDWLAAQAPSGELAWDCATGNGQAALALADRFKRVVASDASAQQLSEARRAQNIDFRNEPAECSSLESATVDLLSVAQAWHWFDHPAFAREAERVLKPAAILAVWAYPLATVDAPVDAVVHELYEGTLGEWWPKERALIEDGYAALDMPWPVVDAPGFEMTARWDLAALMGYLGTWSALRRFMAEKGHNPLDAIADRLSRAWGDADSTKDVRWPLILKVFRKPS
ncbi:MAG: class I SAM-dependent methyltransferase [Xanthomonadales bacterium]|nr:class I SAM-dependent methyltransferase [Xanthomonadales bacterium]